MNNNATTTNTNIESIITNLNQVTNREQAQELISNLKKSELIKIAKGLKIFYRPTDKKDMIVKRIIEEVIGFKLRQEAIESLELREVEDI